MTPPTNPPRAAAPMVIAIPRSIKTPRGREVTSQGQSTPKIHIHPLEPPADHWR